MTRLALSAALLSLAGCDMFDRSLYERAQASGLTSDTCIEAEVPVIEPGPTPRELTLEPLGDDWQVANCGAALALGNEGFFAVDLEAGEKLHVHVDALDALDPVLYVVDSCDERVCQPLNAANHCASGKEHLSFLAPRASRYFVGVDSVDPGGGRVSLLAIVPECGNGEKEHSEACEDGNVEPGDGCDPACRFELDASERTELEPNDDLAGGNVLAIEAGTTVFRVRGRLEGTCDPEVFSFDLPEPRTATFRVVDAARGTCIAPGPGTALQLTLHRGTVEIARAVSDAQGCLTLPGIALAARQVPGALPTAASTYHVQLRALPFEELVPVDYALAIELE